MEEITLINGQLTYRGQTYNYSGLTQINTAVNIALLYDGSEFEVTVVANEVSINGIVQTSAQMIIDTLSSDGQS
jgi:osmotically-inducible protein OsmY